MSNLRKCHFLSFNVVTSFFFCIYYDELTLPTKQRPKNSENMVEFNIIVFVFRVANLSRVAYSNLLQSVVVSVIDV